MAKTPLILLPGGVLPAGPAYGGLIEHLGDDVDARAKDLEVYAADTPPPGYDLHIEVTALLRFADEAGFESFHLLGYSAGGAIALYAAAESPGRLRSLALMEPAWAGTIDRSPQESAVYERLGEVMQLSDETELMRQFIRIQLAPGIPAPERPAAPPPPWMARRPAGLRALIRAFDAASLDPSALRAFDRPVSFMHGGHSNPDLYARMGVRLEAVFPDYSMELYAERHHFDPPHRTEPARVAESLRALWQRAEASP